MKNQKNLFLLLLLLISFLISGNNISAAELLGGIKYTPNCIPLNEADPETGCRVCGDIGDNSITIAYEQCRQSYFVKQQTELVGLQQIPQKDLNELQSENQKLQELVTGQNKQIGELIKSLEQQNKEANFLVASLENAKIINIGFSVIIGAFIVCLIVFLIKKKKKPLNLSQK